VGATDLKLKKKKEKRKEKKRKEKESRERIKEHPTAASQSFHEAAQPIEIHACLPACRVA
jgi:hypothetical protein